jgi:hypothetical protein
MMNRKIIMTVILALSLFVLHAQSFEKDMELAYQQFVNSVRISYHIKYVLHENHQASSRVIMESKGKFVKEENSYISVYDTKASLVTNQEIIMVDHDTRRIRIKKLNESDPSPVPDALQQIREYNKNVAKITSTENNSANTVTYRIELKKTGLFPISHYEITLHAKSHYIEQLTLFYKKPIEKNEAYRVNGNEIPRLDILFYDVNASGVYSKQELENDYYYIKNNKQLLPSSNFKNYDVKEVF